MFRIHQWPKILQLIITTILKELYTNMKMTWHAPVHEPFSHMTIIFKATQSYTLVSGITRPDVKLMNA